MTLSQDLSVPVIAIDGGAGTGKGTVREILARKLGFAELDSGALYRVVAYLAIQSDINDVGGYVEIARSVSNIKMEKGRIIFGVQDINDRIRTPEVSKRASVVAKVERVRSTLREAQLSMRVPPGLVAEGRDMGEIFVTPYMFFLTASDEVKAERRWKQLRSQGTEVSFERVLAEIKHRDALDANRAVSPMRLQVGALLINTDPLTAEQVAEEIFNRYLQKSKR